MYAPKQFREERKDVLLGAIMDIKLATLVAVSTGALEIAHIPMLAHQEGDTTTLECHVARGNAVWRAAAEGASAAAIFQGPQAYIHPGWLATKRETGRAVPTWNYVAVHAHGRITVEDDASWLLRHLDELTHSTETGMPEPWSMSDAPDGFIDQLVRGIVGLRLRVDRLEGAWKMIQHHPEANRIGVIAGLAEVGNPEPSPWLLL